MSAHMSAGIGVQMTHSILMVLVIFENLAVHPGILQTHKVWVQSVHGKGIKNDINHQNRATHTSANMSAHMSSHMSVHISARMSAHMSAHMDPRMGRSILMVEVIFDNLPVHRLGRYFMSLQYS